jgi:hypothetical protein
MIAVLAALPAILGALAGMVPAIVQLFTLKAQNAQQLAMAQLQLEAQKEGVALQVDLANAQADIRQADHIYSFGAGLSGNRFVDGLAVFVRPYVTLVFFHLWILLEVFMFIYAVNSGYDLGQLVKVLWPDETQAMFGAIIGFWFGDRMMLRGQDRMAATLAVTKPTITNERNEDMTLVLGNIGSFMAGGALIWFGRERIQSLVIDANTLSRKLHAKADAIAAASKK